MSTNDSQLVIYYTRYSKDSLSISVTYYRGQGRNAPWDIRISRVDPQNLVFVNPARLKPGVVLQNAHPVDQEVKRQNRESPASLEIALKDSDVWGKVTIPAFLERTIDVRIDPIPFKRLSNVPPFRDVGGTFEWKASPKLVIDGNRLYLHVSAGITYRSSSINTQGGYYLSDADAYPMLALIGDPPRRVLE
jgi:hypothetical protein